MRENVTHSEIEVMFAPTWAGVFVINLHAFMTYIFRDVKRADGRFKNVL